ncbi:MAG: hypothetical protein JRN26_01420 [Nitrososphaerota archaeon]|nr:hypothetical protein [Nitrososphaerota archaeon]MDG6935538.1 hypothetical protein [Nitrososphaerota archaeon]MDG6943517.1 hypothetical protein [Nitrososphaerota archaeon]
MRKNRVYSIAWSRAVAGRIPSREELLSYLSLSSERELMERVTRKLGIKQQYDSVDLELKNFIGTTAINMYLVSDVGAAQLRSLQIYNIRLAIERKIAGFREFERNDIYSSNGVPLLEMQAKRIFEADSLERVRTGESWVDELLIKMRRTLGEHPDAGTISLFLERERIIFNNKWKRLGSMAKFEVDAFNTKVGLMIGNAKEGLADSIYIGEKPKIGSLAESLASLQKKYSLHSEPSDLDLFIENARYELAMRNMIKFDESNSYAALQLLLGFEKKVNAINQSIRQKISKEYTLKIIS